ncbi:MAG TPA: DUF5694 domain-containing protein [Caulobacteraceae bacterium]|jgi:hypothetical protein|nr:DUF5694 domain-containing protein [Caulobacteraceae bacterium]
MSFAVKVLCAAALSAVSLGAVAVAAPSPSPVLIENRPLSQRPTLMILGSVHLGNPHRDLHDPSVDDVLAPERQRQIGRVVDAMATWKPTHIAVEWGHKNQVKLDKQYDDYLAGKYVLAADEIDQLAFKLGKKLGLKRIDAVDWNEDAPGPDDAYDWEKGAKIGHQEARFAALRDPARDREVTALVHDHTVAGFLRAVNAPKYLADSNRVYYDLALLGDAQNNPGAMWVGYWHARNLNILDNLIRLDAKPSDRVLLIIGAGHAYLLNEYAADSHAFRVVRPDAWLAKADKPTRKAVR